MRLGSNKLRLRLCGDKLGLCGHVLWLCSYKLRLRGNDLRLGNDWLGDDWCRCGWWDDLMCAKCVSWHGGCNDAMNGGAMGDAAVP